MPTVSEELERYRGAGPGFDFWRFFLSASIIFLHSFHVSYGTAAGGAKVAFLNPAFGAILPIFFGLSGFLVAGSAIRTAKLSTFLGFRAIRLIPALFVEVTLAALLLGPILTTKPLWQYFTNHDFWAYWGNIVGRVRFRLPGVFEGNPVPLTINENLWTLHAELVCYGLMAAAMLLGLLHRRRTLLALWGITTALMTALTLTQGWFLGGTLYSDSLWIYAFCTGVVAFVWRDRIALSPRLALPIAVLYVPMYFVPNLSVLAITPLIYIMIWVGMQPRLQSSLFKKGDYSYGLYLYGFVIQQTIAWALPQARVWWILFPSSLLLTLGFAILSWHWVEKPALRAKKWISRRAAAPAGTDKPHEIRPEDQARLAAAEA
jgi:peptidoglycan/LPS O-acetylase OafA/YrhL